ncbi:hypothetical protein Nepgr_010279 [Nepenthes gracilis]|uniref:Uncharacterized protein n=1 Tax=Nepenthes gracilis TaxID=150966 RepID=A0AAD3SCJ4_NEPGR|nr:hypothetical protein Nepgr_010279 [Nepenthes gracilis]
MGATVGLRWEGTIDGSFELHWMREIWAPPWSFDYCVIGDGKREPGSIDGVSCCFISPASLEFEQGSQGTAFGALGLRLGQRRRVPSEGLHNAPSGEFEQWAKALCSADRGRELRVERVGCQ